MPGADVSEQSPSGPLRLARMAATSDCAVGDHRGWHWPGRHRGIFIQARPFDWRPPLARGRRPARNNALSRPSNSVQRKLSSTSVWPAVQPHSLPSFLPSFNLCSFLSCSSCVLFLSSCSEFERAPIVVSGHLSRRRIAGVGDSAFSSCPLATTYILSIVTAPGWAFHLFSELHTTRACHFALTPIEEASQGTDSNPSLIPTPTKWRTPTMSRSIFL